MRSPSSPAVPPTVPGQLGFRAGITPDESRQWFDRAKRVLAGGISSSARATTTGDLPFPLYITRGQGSRIWDADGQQFIDYLLSYGSTILGHADPLMTAAIGAQLDLGTMFGTCNTVEVELAEQICRMVPGAELVRFANSGSEAICGAIRAARGATGKSKVLKFEGHYHGWVDVLAVSNRPSAADSGPLDAPHSQPHSRGTPTGVVDDVMVCPWNSPHILRAMLQRHGDDLAAVIAEPIVANNACIMPQPGYLQLLREECSRRNIVLIFDEIVTGFRTAPGGAQATFGITPDMAVYSKAMGGGFPISAFTGRRAIMDLVASNSIKHGGTYNGNPLCAAAALHTLRVLNDPAVHERIDRVGQALMEAIRRCARDLDIPCAVMGVGSMFQVVFNEEGVPPVHYRDLLSSSATRYAAFRQSLLEQGIHISASGLACWFVSAAHTQMDTRLTTAAISRAMQAIA